MKETPDTIETVQQESGERLLEHFRFTDATEAARAPYAHLAIHLVRTYPAGPERTVALRKLLESRDCAERAR